MKLQFTIILCWLAMRIQSCDWDEYSWFGCKKCSNAINYCITCSSGARCTTCQIGYKIKSGFLGSASCQPCGVSNCVTYTTDCDCADCSSNYYLADNSGSIVCQQCGICVCSNSYCVSCSSDNYYYTSNPTLNYCQPCPTGCDTCQSQTNCTSCLNTYYLQSEACYQCPTYCECANQTYCTSCVANAYRDNANGCSECPSVCLCENESYCTTCLGGRYKNTTTANCDECPTYCECANQTYCTSCVTNAYRDNANECQACPVECLCENEGYCTSCLGGRFKNAITGFCDECPPLCECANSTYCTSCTSAAFRNLTNNECQQCPQFCNCVDEDYCTTCVTNAWRMPDNNCDECPPTCNCQNQQYCSSCALGASFDQQTNVCTQVCGDNLVLNVSCDLGMGIALDGCQDDCQVEDGFQCYTSPSAKSVCSYTGQVEFKVLNISKQIFSNQIIIHYQVEPNLHMFKSADPNTYLSFNDSKFLDPAFEFTDEEGVLKATFTYEEDIYQRPFALLFGPSSTADARFFATNGSEWAALIQSDDPLLIAYYTPSQYTICQVIMILSILIVVGGSLACLVGIFSSNRLAGLEIMFVIQYCFVCLLWLKGKLALPVYSLFNLIYSTGYNKGYHEDISVEMPPHAYTFNVNALYFSSNFNYIAILYILPLIPLLVTKILYEKKTESKQKMGAQDRLEYCCQMMMYGCMFNLTYLTVCLILYLHYGGQLSDIASLVIAGISSVISLLTFIGFGCRPALSRRFRLAFKRQTVAYFHYFFHIIALVLINTLLCLLSNYPYIGFIPQLFMVIYTLTFQPYKFKWDNRRSAFNYFVMMFSTSLVVFYSLVDQTQKMGLGGYVYPILLQVLLLAGVIWAWVVVVKDIYIVHCKGQGYKVNNMAYKMFQDETMLKKYESEVIHSDLFRARNVLKSFDPVKKANNKQIKEEEDMAQWLKKNNLPSTFAATEMLMDEAEFVQYQNKVWMKRQKHLIKLDFEKQKVYDAI